MLIAEPPTRWTQLRYHPVQQELLNSTKRFRVVPSGRRSGKTELAKRYLIEQALSETRWPDGRFVFAAPTHAQAKHIFWRDAKLLVPSDAIVGKPHETELTIRLFNGAEINVMGLDVPERIEGPPLDGIIADEIGNMKPNVWYEHIRPALSTPGRPGWAWLIGVPEGRNHYYDLAQFAQDPANTDWGYYIWPSEEIIDPDEIASAKADMDERSFNQEYRGSFVDFTGRAYYTFMRAEHARESLSYDPKLDLIFCFDFNVSPGVAAVLQEQEKPPTWNRPDVMPNFTAVIGEVWIPHNSNTPMICRKLIDEWKKHQGRVLLYGDATGGAKGTAKVMGSDWDILIPMLKQAFPGRVYPRVARSNPRERVRINAVNSRLKTADGKIRMLVDANNAPHVVLDLEGVVIKEGTAGEINKQPGDALTHISDAVGYYIADKWPVMKHVTKVEEWLV